MDLVRHQAEHEVLGIDQRFEEIRKLIDSSRPSNEFGGARSGGVRSVNGVAPDGFGNVTVSTGGSIGSAVASGTPGSVLFIDSSGNLGQDNANLFWDVSNARLGIGTSSPQNPLEVLSTGTQVRITHTAGSAFTSLRTLSGGEFLINSIAGKVALGNITPNAKLHISSTALSASAWGLTGIALEVDGATFTDTSSSGTVASMAVSSFMTPTLAASNSVTYTAAANLYVSNVPTAGTNVTIGTPYALWVDAGRTRLDGQLSVGSTGSTAIFTIIDPGNFSLASWPGSSGSVFSIQGNTITNTVSSGTVVRGLIANINGLTLAASNSVTYTDSATLYLNQAPVAGTNVTLTNKYALWIDNDDVRFDGRLSVGTSAAPSSTLTMGGNRSAAAWGVSGIGLRFDTATYTDTTSSGTVTTNYVHAFAQPSLSASNATTYTRGVTLFVAGPPIAGSNVNITSSWAALFTGNVSATGMFGIGLGTNAVTPPNWLYIDTGSVNTSIAFASTGIITRVVNRTLTDTTSGAGTIAAANVHNFGITTLAGTNALTLTDSATLYVPGTPAAGTNVTITRAWSFWVDAGASRFDGNLDFSVSDSTNLVLGTTTGTKIGTSTTQKIGFFNATPVVQPSAYTASNVSTDRSYDANATTIDELADVLGTLIADLKSLGLIG